MPPAAAAGARHNPSSPQSRAWCRLVVIHRRSGRDHRAAVRMGAPADVARHARRQQCIRHAGRLNAARAPRYVNAWLDGSSER